MLNSTISAELSQPMFREKQTVLVAARCPEDPSRFVPTPKTVSAVAIHDLTFSDRTSCTVTKCFIDDDDGLKKCREWCNYMTSFKQSHNWP
jgi:hypothetical protein